MKNMLKKIDIIKELSIKNRRFNLRYYWIFLLFGMLKNKMKFKNLKILFVAFNIIC